ncbi:MAG: alpha/beta hydrolase [Burkholderiales bacterium]|nr:alpha/beta hydrolase [Burkholderiales bacterium]
MSVNPEAQPASAPHPQVVAVLERAARSGLPMIWDVSPFVARRIYRDTRAALSPAAPAVAEARLAFAPGPDGPIPLRAFRPQGARKDEALPALIYFHGGGWVIGDLDTHDVVCRQLANGAHCAVFSVDYRLAPEHRFPSAVEDCIAATRWIADQAKTLAIDPTRIAVGGDSAGGNLAAVVALAARDAGGPRLCYQMLIYPATDQRQGTPSMTRNAKWPPLTDAAMKYFRGHYLPQEQDWLDWRASPTLAGSLAGLPPAYVLTAGFDVLRDEGSAYAERMAQAGVAVEYREYPDMVHAFLLWGGAVDTANAALDACCNALRTAFEARA